MGPNMLTHMKNMGPHLLEIGQINTREKKNGDAPGPLGDFVMWLVTERT